MTRLPDFLLLATHAPGASTGAPSAADETDPSDKASDIRLYKEVDEEWPDPLVPEAGLVVSYLGEDARTTYFGDAGDDTDTPT